MGHTKALHISVRCKNHHVAKVRVDNGSSLNIMSRSTLMKLPVDQTYLKPSTMAVRAFDDARRDVIKDIRNSPKNWTFHLQCTILGR